MNVALKCVEYKLILRAFREHYFSKFHPQSKLNTHSNCSQGVTFTFSQYIPSSIHLGIPSGVEA